MVSGARRGRAVPFARTGTVIGCASANPQVHAGEFADSLESLSVIYCIAMACASRRQNIRGEHSVSASVLQRPCAAELLAEVLAEWVEIYVFGGGGQNAGRQVPHLDPRKNQEPGFVRAAALHPSTFSTALFLALFWLVPLFRSYGERGRFCLYGAARLGKMAVRG